MTIYVVGTDGTKTSGCAAERAAELAAATGSKLHVVCAYEEPRSLAALDAPAMSALVSAQQIVDDQVEELRRLGIDASGSAVAGKLADVLLEEAERVGARMIVVGNRRMQGPGRILGSVANEVAHHTSCDVLIVKTV